MLHFNKDRSADVMGGWMEDLRFYVLFNSISVISGRWEIDSERLCAMEPWPRCYNFFSCSNELSMKFFLLINIKMPTIVGILTSMSGKNSILGLTGPRNSHISWYFYTYEHLEFHSQLSWAWKNLITSGPVYGREEFASSGAQTRGC